VLCCVDSSNGERKWKDGRYGSGQTLLVDDLILIQSERGAVALATGAVDVRVTRLTTVGVRVPASCTSTVARSEG
jgi:hypothetical protein